MWRELKCTMVLLWLWPAVATAQQLLPAEPLPRLTILTEDYGPFNYMQDGNIQGFSTEIIEHILQTLGSDIRHHDLQVLPWARAYQIALVRPNTLLFTVTHTQQRDMLFRWVGPLVANRVVLVAKKSSGLRADSLNALSDLLIGAIRDDVGEQLLVEQGFPLRKVVSNSNANYLVKMLEKERIDALAHGEIASNWYLSKAGLALSDYEVIYTLSSSYQYLAFSRNTPKALVDRFQEAFMKVKFSDTYQQLMQKYPAIGHTVQNSEALKQE